MGGMGHPIPSVELGSVKYGEWKYHLPYQVLSYFFYYIGYRDRYYGGTYYMLHRDRDATRNSGVAVDWAGGVGTQQKQITVVVFGEGGLRYASREYTDIRGWITQRS